MSEEFSNKVAVVTGGSRGIGREIALEFARSSAQTVIVSSSADNLARAAKTIAAAGLAPLTIAADLRTLEGCQRVFDDVRDRFNRCDTLICSAGATRAGNFTELPDQAWIDGYALKFFGCVRLCRLFWPMLKAAQGCVVNIGGGAARSPGADFSIDASVNAAMGNFLTPVKKRSVSSWSRPWPQAPLAHCRASRSLLPGGEPDRPQRRQSIVMTL